MNNEILKQNEDKFFKEIYFKTLSALNIFIRKNKFNKMKSSYFLKTVIPIAAFISKNSQHKIYTSYIAGGQGSGKSTLGLFIKFYCEQYFNKKVVSFSLDDLYLSRSVRNNLSNEVHPLLKTRGVPGTHDVDTGIKIIKSLKSDKDLELSIPKFSKRNDDLLPKSNWKKVKIRPDIIIMDGWCMGALPIEKNKLKLPINELEKIHDRSGKWRNWVNDKLSKKYQTLFKQFDLSIYIKIKNFNNVLLNRVQQEDFLKNSESGSKNKDLYMTKNEIKTFILYFERITRDMFSYMPEISDIVVYRKNKTDFSIEKHK